LIDDMLDYTASAEQMGKNAGDDLREGKPTLPLLHLMEHGTAEQRTLARDAIVQGGTEHFDAVFSAIHASGALEVTFEAAKREAEAAERAAMQFPPSQLKETLIALCAFSLQRQS
jgi:octaprenyl-diphosphate synthase